MTARQVQRALYRAQRAIGDGRALQRSPKAYVKRVARRSLTRNLFRLFGNSR